MNQELLEMEKKPNKLAFQVALIFAFYSVVIIGLQRAMGVSMDATATSASEKVIWGALAYLPFIFAVVFVQRKHKAELGGYITFGRAFSAGFKTAFYAGLALALFMYLYYSFFDPAALQAIQDNAIAKVGDNADAAAQVEKMGNYMVYFMAFGAAIWYTVFGLIVALIGAAVVKNERPLFIEEDTTIIEEPVG